MDRASIVNFECLGAVSIHSFPVDRGGGFKTAMVPV